VGPRALRAVEPKALSEPAPSAQGMVDPMPATMPLTTFAQPCRGGYTSHTPCCLP